MNCIVNVEFLCAERPQQVQTSVPEEQNALVGHTGCCAHENFDLSLMGKGWCLTAGPPFLPLKPVYQS